MSRPTPHPPPTQFGDETVTYEGVRVVITPEAPHHYRVEVSEADGERRVHAVERVIINTAAVSLDDPVWFADVQLDVGVPIDGPGDTAWVWV
ncbi:MAG: hypothetical protein ABEJ81_00695 [Haloferacaceae archaeon]